MSPDLLRKACLHPTAARGTSLATLALGLALSGCSSHAAPAGAPGSSGASAAVPAVAARASSAPPAPAPTARVQGADPAAVSSAYLAARWTYTYADPAGCAVALTVAGLTTAAFAARSAPTQAALAQLARARESSTVRLLSAGRSVEAPSTDSTTYMTVRFVVTRAYAGAGSGAPTDHVWSLRLTRAGGTWRVDGVVVAG